MRTLWVRVLSPKKCAGYGGRVSHIKNNRAAPTQALSETAPPSVRSKKGEGAATGEEYGIKQGDTLSHIAQAAYGNAALWPAIKALNERKVRGEWTIFTGDKIKLPTLAEAQAMMQQLGFDANGKKPGWPPKDAANTGNRAADARPDRARAGGSTPTPLPVTEADNLVASAKGDARAVVTLLSDSILGQRNIDPQAVVNAVRKQGQAAAVIAAVKAAKPFADARRELQTKMQSTDPAVQEAARAEFLKLSPAEQATFVVGSQADTLIPALQAQAATPSGPGAPAARDGVGQASPEQAKKLLEKINGDPNELAALAITGAVDLFSVIDEASKRKNIDAVIASANKIGAQGRAVTDQVRGAQPDKRDAKLASLSPEQRELISLTTQADSVAYALGVRKSLDAANGDAAKIADVLLASSHPTGSIANIEGAASEVVNELVTKDLRDRKIAATTVVEALSKKIGAMPGQDAAATLRKAPSLEARKKIEAELKPELRAQAQAFNEATEVLGAFNQAIAKKSVAAESETAPDAGSNLATRRAAEKAVRDTRGDAAQLSELAAQPGSPSLSFAVAKQAVALNRLDELRVRVSEAVRGDRSLYESIIKAPDAERAQMLAGLDEDKTAAVNDVLAGETFLYAAKQYQAFAEAKGDAGKLAKHVLSAEFDSPLNNADAMMHASRALLEEANARKISPEKLIAALDAQLNALPGKKIVENLQAATDPAAAEKALSPADKQAADAYRKVSLRRQFAAAPLVAASNIAQAKKDPTTLLAIAANSSQSALFFRATMDAIAEEALKTPGLATGLVEAIHAASAAAKPIIEQARGMNAEQQDAFMNSLQAPQLAVVTVSGLAPALEAELKALSEIERAGGNMSEVAKAVTHAKGDARTNALIAAAEKAQGAEQLVALSSEAAALQKKMLAARPGLDALTREMGAPEPGSAAEVKFRSLDEAARTAIDQYTSLLLVRMKANDAIVEDTQKKLGVPYSTVTVQPGQSIAQAAEAAMRTSVGPGQISRFESNLSGDLGKKGLESLASLVESVRAPRTEVSNAPNSMRTVKPGEGVQPPIAVLVEQLVPKGAIAELEVTAVPLGKWASTNVLLKVTLPTGDVARYAIAGPAEVLKGPMGTAFKNAWREAGNDPLALMSHLAVPPDATPDQINKTLAQLKANDAKAKPPTTHFADFIKASAARVELPTLDSKPERLGVQVSQLLATSPDVVKKLCRGILPPKTFNDPSQLRDAIKTLPADKVEMLLARWNTFTAEPAIARTRIDDLVSGKTKTATVITDVSALNSGRLQAAMKQHGLPAIKAQMTAQYLAGTEPRNFSLTKDRVKMMNELGADLAPSSDRYMKWLSKQLAAQKDGLPFETKPDFVQFEGDGLRAVERLVTEIDALTKRRGPTADAEVQLLHLSVVGINEKQMPMPVFKVKTLPDGAGPGAAPVWKIIDSQGNVFENFEDFKARNEMMNTTIYAPKDGEYQVGADGQVIVEQIEGGGSVLRRARNTGLEWSGFAQYGVMGASAAQLVRPSTVYKAALVAGVSTLTGPLGLALMAAFTLDSGFRAYEMAAHSSTPWQKLTDFRDPNVRQVVLWGVGGSALQLAGIGAMMRAAKVSGAASMGAAGLKPVISSSRELGAAGGRARTISSMREATRTTAQQLLSTNRWAANLNKAGIGTGFAGVADIGYQYYDGRNTLDADTLSQLRQGMAMGVLGSSMGIATLRGSKMANLHDAYLVSVANKGSFKDKVTRMAAPESAAMQLDPKLAAILSEAKINPKGLHAYNQQALSMYISALNGAPVNRLLLHTQLRTALDPASLHQLPHLMAMLPRRPKMSASSNTAAAGPVGLGESSRKSAFANVKRAVRDNEDLIDPSTLKDEKRRNNALRAWASLETQLREAGYQVSVVPEGYAVSGGGKTVVFPKKGFDGQKMEAELRAMRPW